MSGRVPVSGAKNAALPCIAAALLTGEAVTLNHLPAVSDIRTMVKVLEALGTAAEVTKDEAGFELSATLTAAALEQGELRAPYELVKTIVLLIFL